MRKRTLIRPKDVGSNATSTENKADNLKSGKVFRSSIACTIASYHYPRSWCFNGRKI